MAARRRGRSAHRPRCPLRRPWRTTPAGSEKRGLLRPRPGLRSGLASCPPLPRLSASSPVPWFSSLAQFPVRGSTRALAVRPLQPRFAPCLLAPTPARVPSRLGYPMQRGLRASRSGGSLPGSERRRPPPLGRAQPQLPPAAAAAPPPGAAAALGRRLLLLLWRRRLWLLPAAPRGEKHKAQRPPPAGSPPAARPPAPASARTPPAAAAASAAGAGRRRREKGGGGAGGGAGEAGQRARPSPWSAHRPPGSERQPARLAGSAPSHSLPGRAPRGAAGRRGGSWGDPGGRGGGKEGGEGGGGSVGGGGGGGGCCCRRGGGAGAGRHAAARMAAGSEPGRAGAESDLARPAGELAGSTGAEGRAQGAAAERVPGGPPGGRRGSGGTHGPAPELSPKSS